MAGINRGDWSEIYVFLTLLQKKVLRWVDDNGKEHKNKIVAIIRPQTPKIEYKINEKSIFIIGDKNSVEVSDDDIDLITDAFKKEFDERRKSKDNRKIKCPSKQLTDRLEQSLQCPFSRASSNAESDIKIRFKGCSKTLGYSIKSFVGGIPTIFGGGENKNLIFEYKIEPKNVLSKDYLRDLNSLDMKQRIQKIINDGHKLVFQPSHDPSIFVKRLNNIERKVFEANPKLIKDKSLEFILADLLLYVNGKKRSYIKSYFKDQPESNIQLIKHFLLMVALGMKPFKKSTEYVTGGLICLEENEEKLEISCLSTPITIVSYLFDRVVFVNPSTPPIDNFNEPTQQIYLQLQCDKKSEI